MKATEKKSAIENLGYQVARDLWVEYNTPLYNGYTVQEIEKIVSSLNWHKEDKKRYLSNVKQVIEIQMSGVNLNEIEGFKNQNFAITKFYLKQNN